MNYVLIGNSVAAVNAVVGIREYDREGSITIVSAENYYAYGRPLISYWLEKRVQEQDMPYRPQEFYAQNNVHVLLGRRAVKLDPEACQVYLDNGEKLPYDRLLLATGGRPFVPPIAGLTPANYFTFINYDDVRRLEAFAIPGREAVILGAGPTGLKAMESLVQRGVKVTLVELADRIWAPALDPEAGALIAGFLQDKGVNLYLNDTLTSIRQEDDGRLLMELKSGRELKADILVIAIGVRPNVELLEGLPGVTINRGVVVGSDLSTGLPGVYAAGDVVDGNPPLLPHAAIQGKIAGRNMAGAGEIYQPLPPYNALGFLGLHIISMGNSAATGEEYELLTEVDPATLIYRKLVLKDNRLVGGLLINKFDRAGIYRQLLEEGIEVTSFKDELLRPDFGLLSLPETIWQQQLAV
ncbi:FAD-dependent pyridine nucleotide-disulphide oxidoreductase [Moorella glycerini]|uniref:NADH-dependent phenylglyoxylate dehydrogenase subunit epsilon n=1 Tax=Neomoorella stamsii TaxID=1266720 RepID=A0A9X7J2P9_9FIRM|nr:MULTISPECIES: FAD-dependent oxidoreductase [Moorella]PRR72997.1 NADH-dependent phenylglyoxylate dehydrogenase subunit epsilon [Moorella stamsii]CEP67668.1 FAD-dependent pyridine nucleotide-disulphide oxidoreductase [Moorella glycerini]